MNLLESGWSWWSGQTWPIAFDLGAFSVRSMQLSGTGAGLGVTAAGRYDLPEWTRQPSNHCLPLLREAVEALLEAGEYRGNTAVVVLPEQVTQCRSITLDLPADADAQQAVAAAAAAQLADEHHQAQHVVLSDDARGGERRVQGMLIAVERAAVERVADVLREVGLESAAIEVGPLALPRCMARLARRERDQHATRVLIDAGHGATRVALMLGRRLTGYQRVPLGAAAMDRGAAESLGPAHAAVELRDVRMARLAHWHGRPTEGEDDLPAQAFAAARGPLDELAEQVEAAVGGLVATQELGRPSEVRITGGGAYDGQLIDRLSERLGVTVKPAEPLHGVDVSKAALMIERRSTQPEWAVAMGAALRSVTPSEQRGAA